MGWVGYFPRATSLNTLIGGCTFRQPMTHILETNPSLTTACEVDVVFLFCIRLVSKLALY